MSRRAWLMMGVLAATWGASYLFIKVAEDDLGAGVVVSGRTALAALVLMPVARRRNALAPLRGRVGPLVVLALAQVAAPFVLITLGERWIASSLAGILVAGAPIFTALLALRFDAEERAAGVAAAGIAIGIAGVALLFGVDLSGSAKALAGGAMVLAASAGYAAGALLLKRTMQGVPSVGIAAATMAISAVVALPLVAVDPPSTVHLDSAAALLALGVLGTGLAFAIYFPLIVELGPARAALVTYLAPGFAVVYGAALLGESITVSTVAGLVLILVGSYLGASGRTPRRRVSRSGPSRSSGRGPARAR